MILAEHYILLALDDETGKFAFTIAGYADYGVAGAVLTDLLLNKRIEIIDGNVKLVNEDHTGNKILNEAVNLIRREPNERSLEFWINVLTNIFKDEGRKMLIADMEEEGILGREERVYNKIYKTVRHPIKDPQLKLRILDKIQEKLTSEQKKPEEPVINSLIALVNATELDRSIFEKDFRSTVKPKLTKIMDDDMIAAKIRKVIDNANKEAMSMINAAYT